MTDLLDRVDVSYTDFILPDSSFIQNLVYDEVEATLFVQIDNVIYEYDGVSKADWEGFENATSAGVQYHAFSRGRRSSDQLDAKNVVWNLREEPIEEEDELLSVITGGADVVDFPGTVEQTAPGVLDELLGVSEGLEELVETQTRQVALASAAVVYQGRGNKVDPMDVVITAQTFEQYIHDGIVT